MNDVFPLLPIAVTIWLAYLIRRWRTRNCEVLEKSAGMVCALEGHVGGLERWEKTAANRSNHSQTIALANTNPPLPQSGDNPDGYLPLLLLRELPQRLPFSSRR